MSTEEYHALWRSSAHEAVPYTDDFPEALLVLPELCDGSICQGEATRVTIRIALNGDNSKLTVADNGVGIRNERRLLAWAASKATSNFHRNGHGTKKCLTKWEPDYEKANWAIRWRRPGKNLQTTTGPFKGYSPDSVIDDEGEDTDRLTPSGCEISIGFNATSILEDLANNPDGLYTAVREILQTRYSEKTLSNTEFIIDISHPSNTKFLPRSSKKEKWHSFKTCVLNSIKNNVVKSLHESTHQIDGGSYTIEIYFIEVDGKKPFALKKEFPKYGLKSMRSSRAHISLDGRVIEASPIYQLLGLEANHNDYNGYKVFVNFVPNTKDDFAKLPVPCTTKVSLYENDPVYKAFVLKFKEAFVPVEKKQKVEIDKIITEKKNNKANIQLEPLDLIVTKKTVLAPLVLAVSPTLNSPPAPVVSLAHDPGVSGSGRKEMKGPSGVDTILRTLDDVRRAPHASIVSVAPPAPVIAPPTPVVAPPIPVAPVLPSPPVITPLPPRAVTPVGGHNRLNGCSRQNLFDLLLCFKEKINNLPLETLRNSAAATTEPGLAQKIQAIREIMESL
jgi:hypothetical protein